MATNRKLQRRDFLKLTVLGVASIAAIKVGGRALIGASAPPRPLPKLTHLSPRQAATVTAAALVMVGPAAKQAYLDGDWEPTEFIDDVFGRLPADQRQSLGMALILFEEWTLGLTGFSGWDADTQRRVLASWRTSDMGLKRSVWGFLHAATCSSFSGSPAGWQVMGYPGPVVGGTRMPGQSATFTWDEAVP